MKPLDKKPAELKRIHLLAAEVYNYSFANCKDKLGIRHARFNTYMPNDIRLLEQAEQEQWSRYISTGFRTFY
jgi:hypothetical protein